MVVSLSMLRKLDYWRLNFHDAVPAALPAATGRMAY